MKKERTTYKSILSLLQSNLFVTIVGLLTAIIQARLVTAEDLGFFRQFSILTNYLFFLHLGTYQAIERLYPYYLEKGQNEKANDVIAVAKGWILIVVTPVLVFLFYLIIQSIIKGDYRVTLGWISQVVLVIVTLYGGFLRAVYRSDQRFRELAKEQIWSPVASLLSLPFFWVDSYLGLFLKSTNGLFTLTRLHIKSKHKNKPNFKFNDLKSLIIWGFPRFSASYIGTTGLEATRATLILAQFGVENLGYWSFAWLVYGIAKQVPQAITAVYAPKIIQSYAKASSVSELYRFVYKPMRAVFGILCIIIPVGILGTSYFIPIIIPNYIGSIELINYLLFCLILALLDLPNVLLNAFNKVFVMNMLALVDATVQIIVSIIAFSMGYGLISIPIGILTGGIIRGIGLLITLTHMNRKANKIGRVKKNIVV